MEEKEDSFCDSDFEDFEEEKANDSNTKNDQDTKNAHFTAPDGTKFATQNQLIQYLFNSK